MKNSKMKININRKPIDSHEIGRMQDFGAVMKGFGVATIPFYKKWWFATGSGVAVVGAIIVAVATLNNKPDVETIVTESAPVPVTQVAQAAEQEAFIKPAFKGFDVDFTSIWVNSGEAKNYALPSGTVLKIPACHFTNANGDAIQGKVEIRYREMNDGVDFAVSGIPMTYDSAGQEYLFESAGMFEVQGWQNGQKVFVNPNCPITIEQKTVSSDGKFNMYYLDTANRNWQYIGKPNWQTDPSATTKIVSDADVILSNGSENHSFSFPSLHDASDDLLMKLQKEIDALEKTTWVEPKLMNVNNQNFTIEFDKNQFPEFEPFASTIFGVSDASKFSPTLYKYSWNTAVLTVNPSEEAIGKNGYTLSLANSVYIGNEIPRNRRTDDISFYSEPWYLRLLHTVQGWFGKKRKTNAAQNNRAPKTEEASDFTDSLPPSTFVLIPIDSTQYYYSGSGYRTPVSFTVYPVLDSTDYEKAMADFDVRLKKHDALLKEKRAKEAELKKEIARRDSLYAANMALNLRKQREETLAQQGIDKNYIYAADSAAQSNHTLIVNAFAASKFGIYNCDYPFQYKNPVTKTVTFKDAKGDNFYVGNAFIVVTNKNALMNMNYSNCCDISMSYIKKHRNIFFTVLPDDRIAYYTTEDFNNLPDNQNVYMKLRVSDKKMENISEVKTYLGLNDALFN